MASSGEKKFKLGRLMEQTYEWTIHNFEIRKTDPDVEYINSCCQFGDNVLDNIKDELCKKLKVDEKNIEVGQEDWGWYLAVQKEDTLYEIGIGFLENKNNNYYFSVFLEVKEIRKFLFFNRKFMAKPDKVSRFIQIINEIAKNKDIKVS
jgi:hypothetical protein